MSNNKDKDELVLVAKEEEELLPKKNVIKEFMINEADKAAKRREKTVEIAANVLMQTANGSKTVASGIAKF